MEQLLGEYSNQGGTQTAELILLDQFVEIDAEKLKHQTEMLAVDECILEAQDMVVVVLVELAVQLLPC